MFFLKNKILELHNLEFLIKLMKIGNDIVIKKDKISELRNRVLFSLKIPNYEELAMTSQFDLTHNL